MWRGSIVFNMDVGEKKMEDENKEERKNVQRRPVGNVHILTSEFHQLRAQWISAPDWQLMALNCSSLQWLRRIPALSLLSGHPESSTVETHAFYFFAGYQITTQ